MTILKPLHVILPLLSMLFPCVLPVSAQDPVVMDVQRLEAQIFYNIDSIPDKDTLASLSDPWAQVLEFSGSGEYYLVVKHPDGGFRGYALDLLANSISMDAADLTGSGSKEIIIDASLRWGQSRLDNGQTGRIETVEVYDVQQSRLLLSTEYCSGEEQWWTTYAEDSVDSNGDPVIIDSGSTREFDCYTVSVSESSIILTPDEATHNIIIEYQWTPNGFVRRLKN